MIGEFSGSSTVKPVRDLSAAANSPVFSSTPDYSNDHIGDDVRNSNLEGLDYLPPGKQPHRIIEIKARNVLSEFKQVLMTKTI